MTVSDVAPSVSRQVVAVANELALLGVREALRAAADEVGLGLVDQTKLVTAGSELARNILDHAGTGSVAIGVVEGGGRAGVTAEFRDQGPGIADIDAAMCDG